VCISAAAARRSMLLVAVRCGSVVEYIRKHTSAHIPQEGRVLESAACRARDFSSICLVTFVVIARNSDLEFLRSTKPHILPQIRSAYVVGCVTTEWGEDDWKDFKRLALAY